MPGTTNKDVPKKETAAEEFQTYKSSLPTQRLVTESGRVIHITAGKYITKDKEEIEYLNSLIKSGFSYISKGASITSEEADPMAALRAKIKAELLAEMQQEAPKLRDLGTDPKKRGINPASTATIEAVTAASKSGTAK